MGNSEIELWTPEERRMYCQIGRHLYEPFDQIIGYMRYEKVTYNWLGTPSIKVSTTPVREPRAQCTIRRKRFKMREVYDEIREEAPKP